MSAWNGLGVWVQTKRHYLTLGVPSVVNVKCVAVGDLNWDGKLDVVFANNGTNEALLGNGDGTFMSPVNLPGPVVPSIGVALGDLDGDGTVPAVDENGLPNINQDDLMPSMHVTETIDMSGLDAPGETGSTQYSLPADSQLSNQDV